MNKNPQFLVGVYEELKRVSFPSRKATVRLTLTVLIISLITAAYLGIIDIFLTKLLDIVVKTR